MRLGIFLSYRATLPEDFEGVKQSGQRGFRDAGILMYVYMVGYSPCYCLALRAS